MDSYIGEIRIFAGRFAPRGWALCNGQLLPVQQYTALFSLLGTRYGGDGRTTFALPDLRGRAPMHAGNGNGLTPRSVGEKGGSPAVTLLMNEMPAHRHDVLSAENATEDSPSGAVWSSTDSRSGERVYKDSIGPSMSIASLFAEGGNQPHTNLQPYLGMNFIIALEGVFPPRP